MSTAAEFLRRSADGLRADVEHIAAGRLSKDLPEDDRIRMEAKRIAAGIVEQVAVERLDVVRQEFGLVLAAATTDAWNRGRLVGLNDAFKVLQVRAQVVRPWQRKAVAAARDSVARLWDVHSHAAASREAKS